MMVGFRSLCLVVAFVIILLPSMAQSEITSRSLDYDLLAVEWSPDGSLIAVATASGVIMFNTDLQEVGTLPNYDQQIISLSWSPDSQYIAAAGYPYEYDITFVPIPTITSSLLVWERSDEHSFFLTHQRDYPEQLNIVAVAWSPDGEKLATRESEQLSGTLTAFGTVRIWNTNDWTEISVSHDTYREMYGQLAWSPDSTQIAGGAEAWCYELRSCKPLDSADGDIVFITDIETGYRTAFDYPGFSVYGIAWSSDNQIAIAGSGIQVYAANLSNRLTANYPAYGIVWMPHGEEILVWHRGGQVNIVDSQSLSSILQFNLTSIQDLSINPYEQRFVTINQAGLISLWSLTRD